MLNPRSLSFRLVAAVLLLCDVPFMLGIDKVVQSVQAAEAQDPESYAYETAPTDELRALARSMDYSPLRLFEWVRTHVEFEAYAGSMKGAQGTLLSRRGNDLDQALLLGTLLDLSQAVYPWQSSGCDWSSDNKPRCPSHSVRHIGQ